MKMKAAAPRKREADPEWRKWRFFNFCLSIPLAASPLKKLTPTKPPATQAKKQEVSIPLILWQIFPSHRRERKKSHPPTKFFVCSLLS